MDCVITTLSKPLVHKPFAKKTSVLIRMSVDLRDSISNVMNFFSQRKVVFYNNLTEYTGSVTGLMRERCG